METVQLSLSKVFAVITPRYLYRNDFSEFREQLEALPHKLCAFGAGEALWMPGEYIERVYYIERGIIKTALHDEDGTKKTIYFHGPNSVFPGCHQSQFTIELSLVTTAVTPVTALEFSIEQMQGLLQRSPVFFASDARELCPLHQPPHLRECPPEPPSRAREALQPAVPARPRCDSGQIGLAAHRLFAGRTR
ncbi:Crp/Fnr family transcriptional regulator [Collinsella tanakaei]|nr:Crp/Fnr family transcriptional regulator [Collinsella tanakaei]